MKILITGAGGFLGKHLTRQLAGSGHEVTAIVRKNPPAYDADFFSSGNVRLLNFDLANPDFRLLPNGIEAIYSLAQSSNFRIFPEKAEDIFTVNVSANLKLLQWAVGQGVKKFVYASSGGIYGGKRGSTFQETDSLAVDSPLGFYLGSKLCAEILIQNYRHFFHTCAILRPFFIYGPGQRKDMLLARLIESIDSGKAVQLQGDNGLRLNPVYIDDASYAFSRALNLHGSHVINVAGPDVLTLREICEKIGYLLGKSPAFEQGSGMPADYIGVIDSSIAKLGLQLTNFDQGIRAMINTYLRRV